MCPSKRLSPSPWHTPGFPAVSSQAVWLEQKLKSSSHQHLFSCSFPDPATSLLISLAHSSASCSAPAGLPSLGFILAECLRLTWALRIQHTLCPFLLQPYLMLLYFVCIPSKCSADLFPRLLRWIPLPPTYPLQQIKEGMPSWDTVCSLFLLSIDYLLADVTFVSTSPLPIASGFLILFLVLIRNSCSAPGISSHCEHLQTELSLLKKPFKTLWNLLQCFVAYIPF